MKSLITVPSLLLSILIASLISPTNGEPIQYCKFASPNPSEEINFCMGALIYRNTTSNAHDLYLTMTIHRHHGSNLGWTAIGPGTVMDGALMFIIYGDPLSGEDPIVSIRTAGGHEQPRLLEREDMRGGVDLRVIRSSWLLDDTPSPPSPDQDLGNKGPSYTAWVSLVCYSCRLWPGADISALSISQPWIWAWNSKQNFDVYAYDAKLDMHKHHAGARGWGNFWLDMGRSVNTAKYPPSLPPIRPGVERLGASDTPMSFDDSIVQMTVGPGSYIHGLILSTAFLLLFPAGIITLRSSSSKAFTYHWTIQLSASFLLLLGAGLGLLKSSKINTIHQWVGIGLAAMIGIQGLAGWWHHRLFLRLKRRTWVSYLHIWLGRGMMLAGGGNIVTGLLLRGYEFMSGLVVSVGVIVCLQVLGFGWWVVWRERRDGKGKYTPKPTWAEIAEGHFALEEDESDDDGEGETDEIKGGRGEMEMALLRSGGEEEK